MFSHLAKKLKSKRGGSMVVSMIYFLFAAVVGTFVVSATNGSTYRLTRLREEAQSYHGAKSALNMVTNMFNKMSYTFEGTFVVSATNGSTYRLTRLREEAQSYHGAKSALNMVTNMFNKMSYTFELWERRTWWYSVGHRKQ